jgi:hypothetical protein
VGRVGEAAEQERRATDSEVKPRIYLAECGTSRKSDRERVLADLKSHGYAIFPDEELPEDEAGYRAEVERLLSQCQLSDPSA